MAYTALKERRVPVHTHRLAKALQAVDQLGNRYRESPTDAGSIPAAFIDAEADTIPAVGIPRELSL